jgi:hypothetical protein
LSKIRTCPICGSEANSIHHIIPRSEGGEDIDSNKVMLCRSCHDEVELEPKKWAPLLKNYSLSTYNVLFEEEFNKIEVEEITRKSLATMFNLRLAELSYILYQVFPKEEGLPRLKLNLTVKDVTFLKDIIQVRKGLKLINYNITLKELAYLARCEKYAYFQLKIKLLSRET